MEKKKVINIFITFFIFHKNNVKTFVKWIVNQYPKGHSLVSFFQVSIFNKNRLYPNGAQVQTAHNDFCKEETEIKVF